MSLDTIFHQHNDGSFTIERKQDLDDIVKVNRKSFNDSSRKGDLSFGRRVASIPNVIVEKWLKENINLFDYGIDPDVTREINKRLNSPEYRWMRTHNSRI